MNATEILKYCAFGYSFVILLISFSLSDDLRNPKFFKGCLIAGSISSIIGFILELANSFNLYSGMTLLLMSVLVIYLGIYRILFKIFKAWKGTDPYITSASSSIGGQPIDGMWTKYPEDRKIIWTDFLFTMAQILIPTFTIMGLLFLIIECN